MKFSLRKDIDYDFFYEEYRKLPVYIAIINALVFFVWSIIDICVFKVKSYDSVKYGIMGIDNAFIALLVWWAIGVFVSILAFGIAAIFISPTVKRTDALIYLESQKRKETTHNFKKQ